MSDSTKNKPLIKGFQNTYLALYLQQTYKLNWKSKLKLEIFGFIFFVPKLELELFRSNFCFRAGAGAFWLYFFYQSWCWSLKALGVILEPAPNWSRLSISDDMLLSPFSFVVYFYVLTGSSSCLPKGQDKQITTSLSITAH